MDEIKESATESKQKTKKKVEIVAEYEEKLKKSESETADYKDRWMRVQADFDNFRKRNLDAVSKARADGACDVYFEMLAVMDNLERAIASIIDESDKKGVELIARQMKDVLKSGGVEEIEAEGQDFNPEFHNAVTSESVDGVEEGKVLAVFQKGYMYKGKVLRHSMVKVSN